MLASVLETMGLVQSLPRDDGRQVHPLAAFPEAFCVKPSSIQYPSVVCSPSKHVALTLVPGASAMAVVHVTNPTKYLIALHLSASHDFYTIRPPYTCLPPGRTIAIAITVSAADCLRVLNTPAPRKPDLLTLATASFKDVPAYLHSRLQTEVVQDVWQQIPPEYIATTTLHASCSPWTTAADDEP
ncbi:hypothetical protein SPRG_08337 [Saprolegnia parasitica CBS 223.65]|uniref:MSP domain-containing protein n=1 Tax=Saprolegnia parasitica (strain CBS 223.65) TaxID=695850 RepID=A0A067CIA4_SAPPC|nr:hypothetical protein SPRG_08337 [Saprolegnia parasitica CBS 223.65]KDO26261.1 hypothetical protein SPRG_08337 [Saprolegnia parasitica CBS 223.65]|eukprot:XP_012202970.1 hypothetical protein SPRG_08337 [Saprolegnia parasitica CBS 223.65]